jgi:hypothetical protein
MEELRLEEDFLQEHLNKELLLNYCSRFESRALERRVKLCFNTYGL